MNDEKNKNDYELKVDGEFNTFEGGAIRYNKSKGRFDLIPMNVFIRLIDFIKDQVNNKDYNNTSIHVLEALSVTDRDRFILLIYRIMKHKYGSDVNTSLPTMMLDLAIHFQKGAEKYGEHNCEKGIPLWSFIDSGSRHLMQYIAGMIDEHHYISAIWNFWMAEWSCLKFEEENNIKLTEVRNDCNFNEMLSEHSHTTDDKG